MSAHAADSPVGASPFIPQPRVAGVIFALLATMVWSFNFVVGRGLADAIPPCTLAFCRWLTALCAVLPFALPSLVREWRHFFQHWRYYVITSLFGIAFFNTAIYIGAHSVPALNMSLIATSSPLFTIILSRMFFGEAITRARMAGLVIVFFGILSLMSKGEFSRLASLSFGSGDLLLLSAALSFSVYTLLVRKKPEGCGQAAYFTVTFGLGMIILLPAVFWEAVHALPVQYSFSLVGALLYLGLGASLFSFWCWSRAIATIGPAKSAVIYYSLPLFSGIEAVLFLDEPVLWIHFASGALILGGLILATREDPGKRANISESAPRSR